MLVVALAMTFSVDDDVLQILATGCAFVDRGDRAEHRHRLRRPGVTGPRVLRRDRGVHRGGDVRRPGGPDARLRDHRDAGLAAGRGAVSALAGALVAPLAMRLRGLYLAIVTLGLVFIGQYVFREWTEMAGAARHWRARAGGHPFRHAHRCRQRVDDPRPAELYLLMLVLLVIFALLARNLARSRTGRAFAAIRDRDIAAASDRCEPHPDKMVAFAVSSFYAGSPARCCT